MTATNALNKNTAKNTSQNPPIMSDVHAVLKLIETFGSLLVEETKALKKSDFKHVDMLQADKRQYAREYHTLVTRLSERKHEIVQLDMDTREKIVRARTQLTVILNENVKALEDARSSAKRLVDRILEVARRSVTDDSQTNYSAKGKTQAYKSSMLSLSVDTSL